jgi:hypothetical protein
LGYEADHNPGCVLRSGLVQPLHRAQAAHIISVEASASAQTDFAINLAGFASVEFTSAAWSGSCDDHPLTEAALFDPPRGRVGHSRPCRAAIDRVIVVSYA